MKNEDDVTPSQKILFLKTACVCLPPFTAVFIASFPVLFYVVLFVWPLVGLILLLKK
jgi:hypothetical protein